MHLLLYDNHHHKNFVKDAYDRTINDIDMSNWTNSLMFLMHNARSFVMKPASIVSMQTSSRACANRARSVLLSSLARWARPRVHANIDAAHTHTQTAIQASAEQISQSTQTSAIICQWVYPANRIYCAIFSEVQLIIRSCQRTKEKCNFCTLAVIS